MFKQHEEQIITDLKEYMYKGHIYVYNIHVCMYVVKALFTINY